MFDEKCEAAILIEAGYGPEDPYPTLVYEVHNHCTGEKYYVAEYNCSQIKKTSSLDEMEEYLENSDIDITCKCQEVYGQIWRPGKLLKKLLGG